MTHSDFRKTVPSEGRGDFTEERRISIRAVAGQVRKEVDGAGFGTENDPLLLARVESARRSHRAGKGVRLEDVK